MEEITIRKELRPLTIDPEFRDIIPPLMDEERQMLEDSIVANGCETPLTVWNNTIVDGHNRYDICQEHGIPFAIMEKNFENREAAMMWMISTQLGRRNLTVYQKGELALKYEPLIKAKAKKRQATSISGGRVQLPSTLTEGNEAGETRQKIAEIAGTSTGTIRKVKKLAEAADEETKRKLRHGDVSINKAYTALMQKEHEGETKICERCKRDKPMSEFSIPSNAHGFSPLCKDCEMEISSASKAAAEVASKTTAPVETQPIPNITSMVMHKGHPIHVATDLPDTPDMFQTVAKLLKYTGEEYLLGITATLRRYTGSMVSDVNTEALVMILDNVATAAEDLIGNKIKEMQTNE